MEKDKEPILNHEDLLALVVEDSDTQEKSHCNPL